LTKHPPAHHQALSDFRSSRATFAAPPVDGVRWSPLPPSADYTPPKAGIDPDASKSWLRRALPVVRSHRGLFITSLVLSFVALILQVEIPLLLGSAVNHALVPSGAHGDRAASHFEHVLYHDFGVVVALSLVAGLCWYFSRRLLMNTAYRVEYDLRNLMYDHMSRMSFGFYDRLQSGQLISRANSDIRAVQLYLVFGPSILVQCLVAVVAFGFMLSIDVVLAVVAMAAMPFIFLTVVRMRRVLFPVSWLIQSRLADIATVVDENINGVRIVKSFAAEGQQLNLLAGAAERLRWAYVKDADIRARYTPVVQNLSQAGLALVILVGGYQVIHHELQVGTILSFSFWIVMLQAPFQTLGMLVMMGQRAAASAKRIYEVIDEQPTIVDRPGATDLADCRGDVRFDSVIFAYEADGQPVLQGFDLHLVPGETVAVVGRTGSGKSTITRLLERFYDVSDGAVRIDGHDVRDLTLASLRAQVGMVLDEPFLFSVSIRDNIAYGKPDADFADIEAAARAAGADEFITGLADGYETVVGERGYTLSGGQRQRIAIARTLLANPPILVLDDATSAIDVRVEQTIHRNLEALMESRTTLIVAHRLSTIRLAERVVLIDGGRVVADGTHVELLRSSPLYSEVLAQAHDAESGPAVPEEAI
jgi:ATP-binding cassette, subfamily B, bacterial